MPLSGCNTRTHEKPGCEPSSKITCVAWRSVRVPVFQTAGLARVPGSSRPDAPRRVEAGARRRGDQHAQPVGTRHRAWKIRRSLGAVRQQAGDVARGGDNSKAVVRRRDRRDVCIASIEQPCVTWWWTGQCTKLTITKINIAIVGRLVCQTVANQHWIPPHVLATLQPSSGNTSAIDQDATDLEPRWTAAQRELIGYQEIKDVLPVGNQAQGRRFAFHQFHFLPQQRHAVFQFNHP